MDPTLGTRRWRLLDHGGTSERGPRLVDPAGSCKIACPVRILQGGEDPDVPWRHALALAEAIVTPDVVFTLIKDGDHRLSRQQDILRMIRAVEEVR